MTFLSWGYDIYVMGGVTYMSHIIVKRILKITRYKMYRKIPVRLPFFKSFPQVTHRLAFYFPFSKGV